MRELKFAVVREDPLIEEKLAKHSGAQKVLLVASGGCTALHLKHQMPHLDIVCYDFNPLQLAHVQRKNEAVARGELAALNVEDASPQGLNQCGAFETLFRVVRHAFVEWVDSASQLEYFFREATASERTEMAERWTEARYWKSVFCSTFHDEVLTTMFGPAAIQHATPGSYPGYFRDLFARGLKRADAAHNPFLQHVFLGYYLKRDAPPYITAGCMAELSYREGTLVEIQDIGEFDLVHLSNIFDWSDDSLVSEWSHHLQSLRPGSWLITRQLNNDRDLSAFLGTNFQRHETLGKSWQQEDRSLFYNQVTAWQRQ